MLTGHALKLRCFRVPAKGLCCLLNTAGLQQLGPEAGEAAAIAGVCVLEDGSRWCRADINQEDSRLEDPFGSVSGPRVPQGRAQVRSVTTTWEC